MKKNNYWYEISRAFIMGLRCCFQLPWHIFKLSRLNQPIVSVFGGKGAYEEGKYVQWAKQLSKDITQLGISVITGGGPGIMQAANCGAFEGAKDKKGSTLGIGVSGVDQDYKNLCSPVIYSDNFYFRKWLLTHYSSAFILLPGGIGTVDEFFEVLNLTKLHRLEKVPVILLGKSYWQDVIDWYKKAYEYDFIEQPLHDMFYITDDLDEALHIIKSNLVA